MFDLERDALRRQRVFSASPFHSRRPVIYDLAAFSLSLFSSNEYT